MLFGGSQELQRDLFNLSVLRIGPKLMASVLDGTLSSPKVNVKVRQY